MIYSVKMFWRPGDGTAAKADKGECAHWVQVQASSSAGATATIFVQSADAAEKLAALINELCADPPAYDPTNMSVGDVP